MRTRPSCTIAHVGHTARCYCQLTRQQRKNLSSSSLLSLLSSSSSSSSPRPSTAAATKPKSKKFLGFSIFILVMLSLFQRAASLQQQKQQHVVYSTRQIRTRYGSLRGIISRTSGMDDVEVYLGVPYATPPLGTLRYMPPLTPQQWRGTRSAGTMPPTCPQKIPNNELPLSGHRRLHMDQISLSLKNQSEDCLYLNLYVPRPNHGAGGDLLPALLLIHGDSYSWGAGNPLEGIALAAHGQLIVVSINFRLGVLGFLKTGSKGSAQGNYGLMDLIAGLHWLRENIAAFGGDPEHLSILGVGTGAALANFLAVSPMASELIERVILLGGSALSPWAMQRDPLAIKRRVAEKVGCLGNVEDDDISTCLRMKTIDELLNTHLESPRFTSGFAPFADGAVLPSPSYLNTQPTASSAGVWPLGPGPGSEFAALHNRDLLIGLTSSEAWLDLTDDDLKNGLNETRRDKILRTYVRNTYRYHLHEIYSTLRNEYTDWERTEQSPSSFRESLLSLLGDGQVAAPLLQLALLHSTSGGRGYFLHFQPGERPSQRGEELPYLLGLPLLRNDANHFSPYNNYSQDDEILSRMLIRYLSNFVHRGDPNEGKMPGTTKSPLFWDSYDSINQLYLEASKSPTMRSHYRGHKMSLWLNLLPQLHRPGYEISMRHHHLSESSNLYEGAVRPQIMAMPLPAPPLAAPSPTEASMSSSSTKSIIRATECSTNISGFSASTAIPTRTAQHPKLSPGPNNLLHKFASNHYQSYTTALTVTIAVGIFLLLLNILIFAGIYHQRDRNLSATTAAISVTTVDTTSSLNSSSSLAYIEQKKKEQLLEAGCSSIDTLESDSNLSRFSSLIANNASIMSSSSGRKQKLVQELEMQLQEFRCSPPPGGGKRISLIPISNEIKHSLGNISRPPSPCMDVAVGNDELDEDDRGMKNEIDDDEFLPEPPPPPKVSAPNVCPGILRQPGTPGSTKKRVQIQEISV